MRISNVNYFISQAFQSIFRNRIMSIATVLTIMVSLFIVGSFALLAINADHFMSGLETSAEVIVYLNTDTARNEAIALEQDILSVTGVKGAKFVSKEDALKNLNKEMGSENDILEAMDGENPLPDYYIVKVDDSDYLEYAAKSLGNLEFVDKVDYGQNVMKKVLSFVDYARIMGVVLVAVLLLSAIFLTFTTIKLTVFSKRREIEVMKYVGSSNSFIRIPFLLKGIILGFFGSLLASITLYISYMFLVKNMTGALAFVKPVTDIASLFSLLIGLVFVGTLSGFIGSHLSINRHLKV